MSAPISLRTRVFTFALLYACIFIAMMIVLSIRIRQSERELRVIVQEETRTLAQLQELKHAQFAFMERYLSSAEPERSRMLAAYGDIRRMSKQVEFPSAFEGRLESFEQGVRGGADPGSLEDDSKSIIQLLRNELGRRRAELDARVDALERKTRNTLRAAFATLYILLIASIAIIKALIDRIVRPLEKIILASRKISEGHYDSRIPERRGDALEIKNLSIEFNRMASNLEHATSQLEEAARTDALTGLPNFRRFRERIEDEVNREDRYLHTFGLLVFDLDHFKQYNDNYGHAAGNEALQQVANEIRSAMRSSDLAARYGGEEFAAILPETNAEALEKTAERIRKSISNIPPIEPGRSKLTVSIGGATYPLDGKTAEELFAVADDRLYQAKRNGRNRSEVPTQSAGTSVED